MKALLLLCAGLIVLVGGTLGQGGCSCCNFKIVSPVVAMPTDAAIVSSTCSTLVIKWKGNPGQAYAAAGTFKNPSTNKTDTAIASAISCDNNQNCTAILPVMSGTQVSWSVQGISIVNNRTFYSYALRGDKDYPISGSCNKPPVATAWADRFINTNSVLLNAWGSHDPDGYVSKFEWKKIGGPLSFAILDGNSSTPMLSNLVSGTYSLELTVTDNEGATGKDTTEIFVTLPENVNPGNLPPVAFAGSDFTLSASSTILNAWGSYDPEGYPLSYSWKKTGGPDSYNILYGEASTPQISNLVNGTYTFQLTVFDMAGASASDEVKITVNMAITGIGQNFPASAARQGSSAALPKTSVKVILYPSPVMDILNLKWNSDYTGNAQVVIVDAAGKAVRTLNIKKQQPDFTSQMSVSILKPGMYYVYLKMQNGTSMTTVFLKE